MNRELTFSYVDHVLVCDNHLSQEQCDYLIGYFDRHQQAGFTVNQNHNARTDQQLAVGDPEVLFNEPFSSDYVNSFWDHVFPKYLEHNPVLQDVDPFRFHWVKIQKTQPRGGFHQFHCEHSGQLTSSRLAVVMTYLNTVDDGGDTEFIQQKLKVKAVAGRTVLWPAAYTHPHRGNPPYSNDKYIITGWLSF